MAEDVVPLEEECFFIAPIGGEGSDVRKRSDDVLQYIVARAADELGLRVVRADQIGAPGQINLQVLEHVLGAKAAVADLTGHNPNVFYELAVRHTAKLPVVLIADESERDSLPFDLFNMRTIFFNTGLASADNCRKQLAAQLREALAGAVDSPIATVLSIKVLESGDPVEQALGDLVSRVEDLAAGQARTLEMLAAMEPVSRIVGEYSNIQWADRLSRLPDIALATPHRDELEYIGVGTYYHRASDSYWRRYEDDTYRRVQRVTADLRRQAALAREQQGKGESTQRGPTQRDEGDSSISAADSAPQMTTEVDEAPVGDNR